MDEIPLSMDGMCSVLWVDLLGWAASYSPDGLEVSPPQSEWNLHTVYMKKSIGMIWLVSRVQAGAVGGETK